ncbi:hypothetical protein [Agromyces aerolatus]|uniref:hypothetical protein n=1 Tax=Agromyces sp. LY-1074 TaxID=3074080 RepID=UPI002863E4EF|nr:MULTISPECIES: hypothetical protein [unclassified Agromyces]MDR5701869.1 hypothetical protein [Agromyces sp. LY-1074]MDR5708117.1 hypothetical protein [Agromyces sp. LY-1358]
MFAITGSSGRWAVWGQRSWDLGILLSDSEDGPWKNAGVEFLSIEEALEYWVEPTLGPDSKDVHRPS